MLKVIITVSKKVPIPHIDYSSQTASCSIEGEVMDNDPIATAEHLYHQAELAVNSQLGMHAMQSTTHIPTQHDRSGSQENAFTSTNGSSNSPQQRTAYHTARSGSHSPHGHHPRKAPHRATASQLKFIRQLLTAQPAMEDTIHEQFNVHSLEELTVKEASNVIDLIKQPLAGQ